MKAPRFALVLRIFVALTVVLGASAAFPSTTFAQTTSPKLSAKLSATRVEVGEIITLELRATTQGTDAEPIQITLPAGLQKVGESAMQGGGRTRQLVVSWQLMAVKPGRYTIPGPAVQWNGKRFTAGAVTFEATASTGRRSNPFMLPGGITIDLGGGDDDDAPTEKERADLALAAAPDNLLFLRAVADKKAVVIGEQVTVTFYAYFRANFHPEESHDAPFDDFRTVSILDEPGTQQGALYARAGQDRFNVKVIGRIAAFPLKAGVLHTGTAKMKLSGFRMGPYTERESNDEVITVTEPPIAYRPPGYRFGDVGQFKLEALVQARRIDQGGAVPVLITVTGSGNFPDSIRVPERTGIEWLDPEKKE
ncbi:MAG: BatD family protein, partial [Byssovorax sp.]